MAIILKLRTRDASAVEDIAGTPDPKDADTTVFHIPEAQWPDIEDDLRARGIRFAVSLDDGDHFSTSYGADF
jgi:hypothetical protein